MDDAAGCDAMRRLAGDHAAVQRYRSLAHRKQTEIARSRVDLPWPLGADDGDEFTPVNRQRYAGKGRYTAVVAGDEAIDDEAG